MRNYFWMLAPDEMGGAVGGGASAQVVPASSAPAAAPAAAPVSAPPASGGGSAGIGQGGGGQQSAGAPASSSAGAAPASGFAQAGAAGQAAAPTTPAQMESIRDVVARLGGTDLVNQFTDDTALLQHLIMAQRQAQQLQPLARYGERVVDRWPEVEKLLGTPAAGAQQQDQGPWYKPFFNPPPYDPAWEKQIIKGADGQLHAAPGAPPDVVQRYAQYQQFRGQMIDKFASNPFEFMAPAIKHLAREEAQNIAREQLQSHQNTQFASQWENENRGWLYQNDQAGNPMIDPATRQPVLSEWGSRFRQYAVQAKEMGVSDIRLIQQQALRNVQLDYMLQQQSTQQQQTPVQQQQAAAGGVQQQVQTPQQQANQRFLQGARGAQNAPNVGPAPQVPGQNPANQVGMSLKDRLKAQFVAAGVNMSDQI